MKRLIVFLLAVAIVGYSAGEIARWFAKDSGTQELMRSRTRRRVRHRRAVPGADAGGGYRHHQPGGSGVKDFSIDIETLGNRPYSVIIAIGICAFDRHTGAIDGGRYFTVKAEDAVKVGLRMDPSTVLWWMNQSDEARAVFKPGAGDYLASCLLEVGDYISEHCHPDEARVWGNGSGFDINLMENAYEVVNLNCPWKFSRARDMRTVVDLAGVNPKEDYTREGVHHNALDDARFQAMVIADCIKRLAGPTAEQLTQAIREADSLDELNRLVGPSSDQNELARWRIDEADRILQQAGGDFEAMSDSQRAQYESLMSAQRDFENRFC